MKDIDSDNSQPLFTKGNFLNFILDQLSEVENFTFKKFFGGIDFYKEGYQFGTIRGGKFLLQIDPACNYVPPPRPHYGEDMASFDGSQFFEVPNEILANKSVLSQWVERAFQAAIKKLTR